MLRLTSRVLAKCCFLYLIFSLVANFTWAQSETATVSGQVVDPAGLSITGAQVKLVDIDRDIIAKATTSSSGLYMFPSVRPGRYRVEVTAAGFKVVNVTGLTVNVQDHLEQNFKLVVGSLSESITVEGGAPSVDTESATVSTVVDRNLAENLPMNGRSFQTLIQLTPGVVITPTNGASDGQFSVNGQRAASNYWMLDGVSANIGIGVSGAGISPGGSLGAFSTQGGTNGLVSIDAMQEFRIQTSTFSPEFGRTPGAQISIVTRAGTNQFHGTAFDYLRNDLFDANDWFADYHELGKPEERQNDFGGTFSGPVIKDRTFFFLSYEGLRLRLPQVAQATVPCDNSCRGAGNVRAMASPSMRSYFDAYPIPNGPEVFDGSGNPTGTAEYNASFSNRSTLDAYSVRVDHRLTNNLNVFGRYNYSPSENVGTPTGYALSELQTFRIVTHTATLGATWLASPTVTSELRLNYSRNGAHGIYGLDSLGGAIPLTDSVLGFPKPYDSNNSQLLLELDSLSDGLLRTGTDNENIQRQFNIVEALSLQKGSHSLKFGEDYRRLTPILTGLAYRQVALFFTIPSAESGQSFSEVSVLGKVPLLLQNLGLFAQDTWRIRRDLTLTYGFRWDLDVSPQTSSGPRLPGVVQYNDPASLALAPAGAPIFRTRYTNFAPRIGVAYQLSQKPGRESVLRGGWGLFYDLATAGLNLAIATANYPFGSTKVLPFGQIFPLDSASAAPPAISATGSTIYSTNPNLKSPYTQQWNVAFEQSIGATQVFSASYVGAVGRQLLQDEQIYAPNANISLADLVGNYATSDYHSLQLQFRRRLSLGLQVLASYTWAHSIDTASTGTGGGAGSDYFVRQLGANANRGPSDFDIRNSASIALTYEAPEPHINKLSDAVLQHWSIQNIFQVRSAQPVDIGFFDTYLIDGQLIAVRPNVVPGIPLYLYGAQYPGGKAFNNTPGAVAGGCLGGSQSTGPFCPPPIDPHTFEPIGQGDLGRNTLRGFGSWQWDLAIHRSFPLRENVKVQFRAELFNVLNHPNFGPPSGSLTDPHFGLATETLGSSLGSTNTGNGGFSSLYQLGGPRSVQFALKLMF